MSIKIRCPFCNTRLRVPDNKIDKTIECPACNGSFLASADVGKTTNQSAEVAEAFEFSNSDEDRTRGGKKRNRLRSPRDVDRSSDDGHRPSRKREPRRLPENQRELILLLGIASPLAEAIGLGLLVLLFQAKIANLGSALGIILGLGGCVPGLAAWVLAHHETEEIDEERMDDTGTGLIQLGGFLGAIGAVLPVIGLVGSCLFLALLSVFASKR